MNKNPFDSSVRTLDLYERLKTDVSNKSENIIHSLPQFLRMALIEKENGWYSEINRFDLIILFSVHKDFSNLFLVAKNTEICTKIKPDQTGGKSITEHMFLTLPIISLSGELFTVQDFVLAIAYHGTFHRHTDKIPLEALYKQFIEKYSDISFQMALDIGDCFVNSFKEAYEKFNGDNNAYSHSAINGLAPILDTELMAIKYSNAYTQLPIRSKYNCGIRICLDIKIEDDIPEGFIFSFGHRDKNKVTISCEYVTNFLLIKTKSTAFKRLNTCTKIPLEEFMKRDFFKLEVALYKTGKLVIAVNEWLKDSVQMAKPFDLYDGKLVIGADLNGEKSGSFCNRHLSIEAIDKRNQVSNISLFGLSRVSNFPLNDLPSNLLKRPALVF